MGCCQSDDATAEEKTTLKIGRVGTPVPAPGAASTVVNESGAVPPATVAVATVVSPGSVPPPHASPRLAQRTSSSLTGSRQNSRSNSPARVSASVAAAAVPEHIPVPYTDAELREIGSRGEVFVKYPSSGLSLFNRPHERNVTIEWTQGVLSFASGSIEFRHVTSISAGKAKSESLRLVTEQDAPDARCLVVRTKDRSLDLLAASTETRDKWMFVLGYAWHQIQDGAMRDLLK